MIYFTSDFHFAHITEDCWKARGFSSMEEMCEKIIENYNKVVRDKDHVYILGNCMLNNNNIGLEYMKRLKGKKHLIVGNHDTNVRIKLFQKHRIFEDVEFAKRTKIKQHNFWLSHYPMQVGEKIMMKKPLKNRIINLSGHTRTKDRFELWDKYSCYNVGMDAHNFYPIPLDKMFADMQAKIEQ